MNLQALYSHKLDIHFHSRQPPCIFYTLCLPLLCPLRKCAFCLSIQMSIKFIINQLIYDNCLPSVCTTSFHLNRQRTPSNIWNYILNIILSIQEDKTILFF